VSGERELRPATLAAQPLGWIEPTTRALVPPIHVGTTYQRDADGLYRSDRGYTHAENPSYDQTEVLIKELEGGAGAGADWATCMRERAGISAFALEDGVVYDTYSAYASGPDGL
jgi:hypothetical protein